MLRDWMRAPEHDAFEHARRARTAYATAGLDAITAAMFDEARLHAVLSSRHEPDLLVVANNQLLSERAPKTSSQARELLGRGIGLVIRKAQRHDPQLSALAARFALEFDAAPHIQLFVTPARSQGFGWHYDADDVIILQTVGSKQYYLRQNTVVALAAAALPMDFTEVLRESSPTMACTLQAGDALYLPRGMWHAARAIDESFSISLGLEPGPGVREQTARQR